MSFGIGQKMVKLMGQDSGQGASIRRFPVRQWKTDQAPLYKKTHALAIDIDERQDLAVTDMSPAERAGITPLRPQVLGIALTFEMDHRQLGGNLPSGFGQG